VFAKIMRSMNITSWCATACFAIAQSRSANALFYYPQQVDRAYHQNRRYRHNVMCAAVMAGVPSTGHSDGSLTAVEARGAPDL
jgi:hypothetical protein